MLKLHRALKMGGKWVTMQISIVARLIFLVAITILLVTRKEDQQIEHFPLQTWSVKKVLPVYWAFVVMSLILWIFYKTSPAVSTYVAASEILTILAGCILFVAARKIIGKKKGLPLEAIGIKASDVYWFVILIAVQYTILIFFFFSGKTTDHYGQLLWMVAYFSIVLVFWPIIEEVFYLGMMFIPAGRVVGLKTSAVLVSLSRAVVHLDYNAAELVTTFLMFGLLGCYLYVKSKRILVPLLLHSSINFFVLMRDLSSFSV